MPLSIWSVNIPLSQVALGHLNFDNWFVEICCSQFNGECIAAGEEN